MKIKRWKRSLMCFRSNIGKGKLGKQRMDRQIVSSSVIRRWFLSTFCNEFPKSKVFIVQPRFPFRRCLSAARTEDLCKSDIASWKQRRRRRSPQCVGCKFEKRLIGILGVDFCFVSAFGSGLMIYQVRSWRPNDQILSLEKWGTYIATGRLFQAQYGVLLRMIWYGTV